MNAVFCSNPIYGNYVTKNGNFKDRLWDLQKIPLKIIKKSGTAVIDNNNTYRTKRVHNHIYTNSFNDFRNFKLQKDFLFILFSSSNFLHSGPFFNHLECNDRVYFSSSCNSNNISSFYNVKLATSTLLYS